VEATAKVKGHSKGSLLGRFFDSVMDKTSEILKDDEQ
jgi:hypothetical protein